MKLQFSDFCQVVYSKTYLDYYYVTDQLTIRKKSTLLNHISGLSVISLQEFIECL